MLDSEVLNAFILVIGRPGLDLPLDACLVEQSCRILCRVGPGTDINSGICCAGKKSCETEGSFHFFGNYNLN